MTKFYPHPPLFQPRVEKNFAPRTSSLDPPTYKKSRPPHLHFDNSNTGVCACVRAWCLALMCSLLYYYGTISKPCNHSSLAVSELSKGQYNILSLQND